MKNETLCDSVMKFGKTKVKMNKKLSHQMYIDKLYKIQLNILDNIDLKVTTQYHTPVYVKNITANYITTQLDVIY